MKHLFTCGSLLLLICFGSAPYSEGFAGTRKMTVGQFPLSVGSRWVYVVRNSTLNRTDTVHTRIVGTAQFPDGRRAQIWQYRTGSALDTQYTVCASDTIAFYRSKSPESVVAVFVFPLIAGQSKTVIPPGTTKVVRTLTASVPAGKFYHSVEVDVRPAVRNSAGSTTYTLASGVGIVRMHSSFLNTLTDRREDILWELLSWKAVR